MIAFALFGRPVYRYGIFYLITFLAGYVFLSRLPRSSIFAENNYPQLKNLLENHVDDIFLIIILWVILWWRLGHVFFYERWYYSQNLLEIVQVNKWGMSFFWGICGVTIGLICAVRKWNLSRSDLFLLWDMVLCIVPIGSLLGRIWNSLNQELIGKPLSELSTGMVWFLERLNLTRVYSLWDEVVRVDINIIQSLLEWWVLLLLSRYIFTQIYTKKSPQPGLIVWVYMIWYAIVRFIAEFFKDLPAHEMMWSLSVSQVMMIVLFVFGVGVLRWRRRL